MNVKTETRSIRTMFNKRENAVISTYDFDVSVRYSLSLSNMRYFLDISKHIFEAILRHIFFTVSDIQQKINQGSQQGIKDEVS